MNIWSANRLRQACEDTAARITPENNRDEQKKINQNNRKDQCSIPFSGDTEIPPKGLVPKNESKFIKMVQNLF